MFASTGPEIEPKTSRAESDVLNHYANRLVFGRQFAIKFGNFTVSNLCLYVIKLQGTATKKSDAFSLIYLQHYKDTTNVFGSTLALVRYFDC